MREEWKEKMQQRLADYEEAVPEALWQSIESSLPKGSRRSGQDGRGRIIALRIAAAACVAGGIMLALKLADGDGGTKRDIAVSVAQKTDAPQNGKESDHADPIQAEDANTGADGNAATGSALLACALKSTADNTPFTAMVHAAAAEHSAAAEPNAATEQAIAVEHKSPASGKSSTGSEATRQPETLNGANSRNIQSRSHTAFPPRQRTRETLLPRQQTQESPDNRFSASLFAANAQGNSSSRAGAMLLMAMPSGNIEADAISENDNDNGQLMRSYNPRGTTRRHSEHHHPVRAGLSVRYALTKRIGIETGLTYTYLSSDISYESGADSYQTEQQLHFVGIPLNVDYSLWSNRWLSTYLSAGGMVEKNVKGRAATEYRHNGESISTTTGDIKMKRLQWSANVAAGVQLNLFRGTGIFVEPGLAYNFRNGSTIKTAYSEKPLNFNLKIGLRYSFNQ